MKLSTVLSPLLWIAVTTSGGTLSFADERPDLVGGQVLIPDTSIEHADHIGRDPHTNTKVFVPVGGMDGVRPPSGEGGREIAPGPSYFYETPASLGCLPADIGIVGSDRLQPHRSNAPEPVWRSEGDRHC